MARPSSHNQPHFPIQHKSTSNASNSNYTKFLCKSLLFLAFLIFLPFFPSQAPEFINQSILTKFWELIHLLFVGIAVSYGLFSRRSVKFDVETRSHFDDSFSYASRMFHFSSGFEDGIENSCGYNGKKMVRNCLNSGLYLDCESESMVGVCNRSSVLDELRSGFREKAANQAWNSQYFHGESMVVTSNGSSALDEWGKHIPSIVDKPLGLPIRSLRSRIVDSDNLNSVNGSWSGSGCLKGSSKSYGKVRKRTFGDLGSLNLEEQFEECVSLPSPIPWRSRSGRMEMREEMEKLTQIPYPMPISANHSEFEPPKSRPIQKGGLVHEAFTNVGYAEGHMYAYDPIHSTKSLSSRFSSMSSSLPKTVPHSSSISSHQSSSELEEKSSCGSSSNAVSSKLYQKDPLIESKFRPFSSGPSSEMLVRRSFEDELKDFNGGREHIVGGKDHHVNIKPASPLKASLRGKSVRTVRASEPRTGQKLNNSNKVESVPMMKNESLNGKSSNAMLNQTIFECHKGEKQELGENFVAKSDKDPESEADNFQVSSDEEESASFNSFDDVGSEIYEVDKKAGEFIAKFREQIRLQRVESMNGSSGHWATYW